MRRKTKLSTTFYTSLSIVSIFVILGLLVPSGFQEVTAKMRDFISINFGWYYLLLVTLIVVFCLFMIFSPIGEIRLGDPDSKPEYSKVSWIAMLFSAGMGIGLVFWGAAEPLSHFATSTYQGDPMSQIALKDSLEHTFFHWGIHAWSVYAVVALALAYFKFRKKERSLVSVTLKPLFYDKMEGTFGKVVDALTIVATVIGVATTLGFGAVQINSGLHLLFGVEESIRVQIIIISITTVLFMASALSGLGKGVKILSNLNMILAAALLAITMIVGPTVQILNTFVDTIGLYLQDFFRLSFASAPYDLQQQAWIRKWTIFYWAWWISWSPFVGVFIARISKGRTIKEFLTNVLLVPTLFSFLWFAAFGTLANQTQMQFGGLANLASEQVLFETFKHLPWGNILSLIAIILVFSFFITSADSATFVLGMLSEDGALEPHAFTKVIWGVLVSLIAVVLLASGGLTGLENLLILVAFPFSIILVLMCISLYKELNHEKQEMGLMIKPDQYPTKDQPFRSYE